jgi:hypothetical protein
LALDQSGQVDHRASFIHRWLLVQCLVRAMIVIVPLILGQDSAQVSFSVDQQSVEARAA